MCRSQAIGNLRHLDVTNLTTTSWSWSIVRCPAAGTAQLSATNVRNPTLNPDATNDFYVIRFQGWDALGRTAIGTVSVGDDMRPQVIIVSPTWDQQIHSADCTVTGTATDDVEVANVQVQLNDGPWLPASGLTNWTSQVTLIQGVNTIRAYAVDNRGQFSATNSVSVAQTPGPPLLTATHSGSSVVVSWPYPSAGFVLQQNNSVISTNWTTSGFTDHHERREQQHHHPRINGQPVPPAEKMRRIVVFGSEPEMDGPGGRCLRHSGT